MPASTKGVRSDFPCDLLAESLIRTLRHHLHLEHKGLNEFKKDRDDLAHVRVCRTARRKVQEKVPRLDVLIARLQEQVCKGDRFAQIVGQSCQRGT